jgi:VanZ family protein
MLKIIKRLLERSAYAISILLTILIVYLSLSSLKELNVKISVSDKLLHAFAYLVLTLSWLFTILKSHKSFKVKIQVGFVLFIFGIIIEILQSSMPLNRHGDYFDVIANSSGILLGVITFNYLFRFYKVI